MALPRCGGRSSRPGCGPYFAAQPFVYLLSIQRSEEDPAATLVPIATGKSDCRWVQGKAAIPTGKFQMPRPVFLYIPSF